MIATETPPVLVTCPQCYRLVHFDAHPVPDEAGNLVIEMPPLAHAMTLHMRGCTGE